MSNLTKATETAGPPLTDPRIGPVIGAQLLGPTGAMVGEELGAAAGLGKFGMALARTTGMTVATAPLGGRNVAQQAGWTAAMGLATEGALAGAGRFGAEARTAEGAAKVSGAMTPAKIKALASQRQLLQAGGSSPEEIDDFINSRDAAQKTKDAFHSVITNQKNEYHAGYQGIFDQPSTAPKQTIGASPVDPAPIAQKIDELNAEVDRRGLNPQESAATKKLLEGMRTNLKGAPVAGGEDPVKTILRANPDLGPAELDTMKKGQLDNYRKQFIKNGLLNPDGSIPGPKAGEVPTVDQIHGFRTNLRNLRGASATNTTEWISNALEDTATQVMEKGMTAAGAKPEDFTTLRNLDGKWRTLNNMEYAFRGLKGAEYGHAAGNALWDIGETKQYETLNDFFKMADRASEVDPTIKPALRESFLTKLVGDTQQKAGTDINARALITRKITDTFRGNTPKVMSSLFGEDSPFADVRQFSNVMGKAIDPNTTNTVSSKMGTILKSSGKVAAYGGSGYFGFRLIYALATGSSPWQDIGKNQERFVEGMAAVVTTGLVATLVLTKGSAVQQRLWADMMLHPESANAVRTFVEGVTPLMAQELMKAQEQHAKGAQASR